MSSTYALNKDVSNACVLRKMYKGRGVGENVMQLSYYHICKILDVVFHSYNCVIFLGKMTIN